jgi:SAM-dependent methyltransferase
MLDWLLGRKQEAAPVIDVEAAPATGPAIEGVAGELMTGQAGVFVFESDAAQRTNRARLEHLDSLGLPLAGRRVVDAGSGPGLLAQYFVARGCEVVCVDGREENIAELRQRYPRLKGVVGDLQRDSLVGQGRFDVAFCYGLLYHLESPMAGLRNLADVCGDLILIESIICDSKRPVAALADEPPATWNQSISPFGCRPSPAWVALALSRLGFHAYIANTAPDFEDYHFRWLNNGDDQRDGHNLRSVFVGSRQPLENGKLTLMAAANAPAPPDAPLTERGQ